ncbi:MAG TPA: hypothetical protein PK347_17690 [Burkholderiaceae bacterium]|nr:hypothetical protein [Burkholderiaceae bacterium]
MDIYMTDVMLDAYQKQSPSLLARLNASAMVRLNYHCRPPKPYYSDYDWAGFASLSATARTARVLDYERFVTDGVTGLPSGTPGGYAVMKSQVNASPGVAAFQSDSGVLDSVAAAFVQLGATWTVSHSAPVNLGENARGLRFRPEHFDLKLFEQSGANVASLMEAALTSARGIAGGRMPYVVGVKMHDNDFFAERSAWLTVYVDQSKRPPWDTSRQAALKSSEAQAEQWRLYEEAVAWAASNKQKVLTLNSGFFERFSARGEPMTLISGTMHIESTSANWPNPDNLLAFFRRATQAGVVANQSGGMRWSIGADIGWLTGEPRVSELVRSLSAMGVQWDVHAHNHADRIRCAERLVALGVAPTGVVSGLLVSEIDLLRNALASNTGYRYTPTGLWGMVTSSGHTLGADDRSAGVWRPKSAKDWMADDPTGNLIAIGGGSRSLAGAESIVQQVNGGQWLRQIYSVSINVSPSSLTVVSTTDGIDQIESWARRVGALSNTKWATLAETVSLWQAAGGWASRVAG